MRDLRTMVGVIRGRLLVAVASGSGTVAAGIGLLATATYLIVRADLSPPILDLTFAIVGVRFFGISRAALRYAERLSGHDAALRLVTTLRLRSFDALERLAPGGIERARSGDLLAGITDDLDDIEQAVVRSLIPLGVTMVVVTGTGIVAWALTPAVAAAVAAGLALTAAAAGSATLVAGRRSARALAPARARLTQTIIDSVEGRTDAIVCGRAGDLLEAVAAADARVARLRRRGAWLMAAGSALVALGSGLTLWLVVRTAVVAADSGDLDPILVGVAALLALAAFEPVAALPAGLTHLDPGAAAAGRLGSLERRPDPVAAPARPRPIRGSTVVIENAGVCRNGSWDLRGIDLILEPGRRVALVGASGAGKSTLTEVVMRFRELDEGSYRIGGTPVVDSDPADVRRLFALADEQAPLMDADLAENLRIADPAAGDGRLISTLESVGLGPLLARLPDGLATRMGPRGAFVSGGERRRIALARALLAHRPHLIVDEPTAGLDPEAARAAIGRILRAGADTGVLLITHGALGLEEMDEIVVLGDGRVVERGTHPELLAAGAAYARLQAPVH